MTAGQVLEALRAAGVQLWVEGDQLRYIASPPTALTAELRALAARHRTALHRLLRGVKTCASCRRAAPILVVLSSSAAIDVDGEWYLCPACYQGTQPPPASTEGELARRASR